MKKRELKKIDKKQLDSKLIELKRDLMKLNSQRASGTPPENPGKIRFLRRSIARIISFSKSKQKLTEVKNQ